MIFFERAAPRAPVEECTKRDPVDRGPRAKVRRLDSAQLAQARLAASVVSSDASFGAADGDDHSKGVPLNAEARTLDPNPTDQVAKLR